MRCHVPGTPVGTRPGDAESLALADREAVHAVVFGQHGAAGVHHRAAAHADAAAEKRLGVAGRDEADVVAVGLLRDGEAAPRGLLADPRLGGVADREQRMTQLLGGQHTEHVGLVLVAVDGASQSAI